MGKQPKKGYVKPAAREVPNRRDTMIDENRKRVASLAGDDPLELTLGGSVHPVLEPGHGPVKAVQAKGWPL